MKHLQLFLFALSAAVATCCCTACSNEEQPQVVSSHITEEGVDEEYVASRASLEEEYINLLDAIDAYNAAFFAENHIQSRGRFGDWLKRLWNSTKSDFGGFSWRDLSSIFSICTSRQTWKKLTLQDKLDRYDLEMTRTEAVIDSLIHGYIIDPSQAGNIHNASVLRSCLDNDMEFETTLQLVKSVRSSFDKLGIEYDDFSNEDMAKELDEFMTVVYDEDVTTMYNNMIKFHPERKGEYEVLKLYLRYVTELTETRLINNYTAGYKEEVKKSNLSEEQKFSIISNLSIAPASFELWSQLGPTTAVNPYE